METKDDNKVMDNGSTNNVNNAHQEEWNASLSQSQLLMNNDSTADIHSNADIDDDDEGDSSSDGLGDDDNNDKDEYQEMHELALKETRRIEKLRFLVVTIILCVGAALSAFTYTTLSKQSEQDAKDAFKLFASTIEENWKFRVSTIFSAGRALSRGITTSAFTSPQKFPYFSVPAWEAKAFESRIQAGFETVTYAPIIANRKKWLNFTQHTRDWLDESKFIYDDLEPEKYGVPKRSLEPPTPPLPDVVWDYDSSKKDGSLVERKKDGIMVTSLHVSPPPLPSVEIYQNINMFSNSDYRAVSNACVKLKDAVFSAFSTSLIEITDQIIGADQHQQQHPRNRTLYPHSIAAQPVYRGLSANANEVVGYIYSVVAWDRYLHTLLPEEVVGILVVLRNSCGQAVTYELQGEEAIVLESDGDVHDAIYDDRAVTLDFTENYFDPTLTSAVEGHCQVFLDVYPSQSFDDSFSSPLPAAFTGLVAGLFLLMAAVFALYDWFVQSRNEKVVGVAARSNAIVSSLFPTAVKERLMADQLAKNEKERKKPSGNNPRGRRGRTKISRLTGTHNNLRGFLSNREELQASQKDQYLSTPPIADFYPYTSILFSDIAGFTAWSSSREPSQVFTLLETIYHRFDMIAKRRKVFKVETIGDCYVAVCGLPDPHKDHAVAMCRFAREAMQSTWSLVSELTLTLGPDTNDLTMRMGIHSGPVTAGVLRGEKGRFQLFGDTMNTASRMESNGRRSQVQISQETADLLVVAGKSSWFRPREDKITAKGKGELQTYWLQINDHSDSASYTTFSNDSSQGRKVDIGIGISRKAHELEIQQQSRLISWNVETLTPLLKKIIAHRRTKTTVKRSKSILRKSFGVEEDMLAGEEKCEHGMVLDELSEVISFDNLRPPGTVGDHTKVELSSKVEEQLKSYVSGVVDRYQRNEFHSFDHASHVTMSIQKLLARIVAADAESGKDGAEQSAEPRDNVARCISNPLTQFACMLSGIIHDVDHPGVSNTQLVKEGGPLAEKYKGRSVAEQHSVDVAWELLMKDEFEDLRKIIYTTESEKKEFRSVVVNSVMATDIMDPILKEERNLRWEKAFNESPTGKPKEARDRKATIVIEYLIQASDVSHTMQHWHIFRKWNEKLFREMYKAYREGRAEKHPGEFWYKGEIGFFEFYIIPLAKKLKECGVFGVSSDEYLNYAEQNLAEWKGKGEQVVAEMIEAVQTDYDGVDFVPQKING